MLQSDDPSAIDELADLAMTWSIDLDRVAVVGHSAGGHLALWSGGRSDLPQSSPRALPRVVPGLVIGLGPVGDLVASQRDGVGNGAVTRLLGGGPAEFPQRYSVAVPRIVSPTQAIVVRGSKDDIVPAAYTVPPTTSDVEVVDVPDEDHFILINPSSATWAVVVQRLTNL
jgi:acetyl esterase/lipase